MCAPFPAFCHDPQAEPPAEVDQRMHDGGVAVFPSESHHERAVDLERVDLELV
jgi:hypothetical protein